MSLVRWTPKSGRHGLFQINNEFDRWLNDFVDDGGYRGSWSNFSPPVDIEETPEAFVLRADLPGVTEKDIKVTVVNDTLTIRGERKREESSNEGGVHRVERVTGSFERSFTLGTAVRNDKVKASYKNGVLEIRLPKAEVAQEREIEINTG